MAPSVTLDNTPDFAMPSSTTNTTPRTLLLAPPSISSHPSALAHVASNHDRNATDIQMLDRLALGLVNLPAATYDVILLLTDVDGSRRESSRLLDRNVMSQLVAAMKVGGRLRAQDGGFGGAAAGAEHTEAILAGLVQGKEGDGMLKPDSLAGAQTAAPMGKRKSEDISTGNGSLASVNGAGVVQVTPAGVGFVDSNDDFDGGFDDGSGYDDDEDMEIPDDAELDRAERINPDSLLSEEDRLRPIIVPDACKPNTKRRRACKDCSCGLAQRIAAEDGAKRSNADAQLAKLSTADLTEVDFTVQGKVGSCGNCALGDAFRCDGCPYVGLPAFKPGEEVRLLSNDVQL
ncbi:electron carrier [Friedmanniomyces endolithicus]|nr:electron carrier [Friedmanniomyces endolithicus]